MQRGFGSGSSDTSRARTVTHSRSPTWDRNVQTRPASIRSTGFLGPCFLSRLAISGQVPSCRPWPGIGGGEERGVCGLPCCVTRVTPGTWEWAAPATCGAEFVSSATQSLLRRIHNVTQCFDSGTPKWQTRVCHRCPSFRLLVPKIQLIQLKSSVQTFTNEESGLHCQAECTLIVWGVFSWGPVSTALK